MDLKSAEKSDVKMVPSRALAAVAFQDQLLRDLSIEDFSLPLNGNKATVSDSLRMQEKRRKLALKKAKPTIDTGLKRKSVDRPKLKPDLEYVLDPQPKPLSLAQKLGLVPHRKDQEKLLSETEWKSLKETSKKRDDFKNPCAICKDDFRLEDQVLLSCSHFFHKVCLLAFERFTGRKTCPMCRHESYQTRVVHEGTKYYKEHSATRIQACWRGYVVRKWYRKLRETVPPKDARLRKKFYENKLSEITDRMVAMTSSDRVDRFLSDVDHSLAHSRNIFRYFEKSVLSQLSSDDWMEIEERAVVRGATECPICLRAFQAANSTDSLEKRCVHECSEETHSDGCPTALALLSCTHVFHATCLNALELFSSGSSEGILSASDLSSVSFRCPVCRAIYQKRIVHLN